MFHTSSRSLIITFLLVLFSWTAANGQNPLDKKVSLHIQDKTFLQIIELVEHKYQVQFSYDSHIIPKLTVFNTHVKNVTLGEFLTAIVKEVNLNYRLINNHLVLFYYQWPDEKAPVAKHPARAKKEKIPEAAAIQSQGQKLVPKEDHIVVYDTVVYTINDTLFHVHYDTFRINLIDTLVIHDTLLINLVDTLVVYDTVQITPPMEPSASERIKSSLRGKNPEYRLGLYAGVPIPLNAAAPYTFSIPNTRISQNTSSYNYKAGWQTGLAFEYSWDKLFIRTILGASYRNKEIQLNYTGTTQSPNTEVDDSYFEVRGSDTTWVNVIEEEFIYTQDTVKNLIGTEHAYFVSIPLELGYELQLAPAFSFGIMGGICTHILLSEKRKLDIPLVAHEDHTTKSTYLDALAGVRLSYHLQENLSLSCALHYSHNLETSHQQTLLSLQISKAFK